MEDKRPRQIQQSSHQGKHPSKWKGLQVRMTLSYILVTIGMVLFLQIIHSIVLLFMQSPTLTWNQMVLPDVIIFSLIAGLFGLVSTRGIIGRLRRIAVATTSFATGRYDQRLPAIAADEIGQLEAHFNQMAEQLTEHLAREKHLVEQNARLEERTHLSRDLHDSIKQQVFALAMQVELARSLLEQDTVAARMHLGEADELSYQVQQELTALIHALRPARLQTKELTAVLRDYVTIWSRQSSIAAEVHLPEICQLPLDVEDALWRLTQEALSNIARHSHATRVELCMEWTECQIRLSLSDNGQGFNVQGAEQEGIGLRSMCERIEQIGGTLQIQSAEGEGTCIVASCPLLPQQASTRESEIML
jgi:two-component system, NarL family, sensor histidine kinase LiaS